eukprot:3767213-Pyramimonas_sp.AAC.1
MATAIWRARRVNLILLTLRVSPPAPPPAHPETMPRGVEVVREVGEHAEQQRVGETVIYPKGVGWRRNRRRRRRSRRCRGRRETRRM